MLEYNPKSMPEVTLTIEYEEGIGLEIVEVRVNGEPISEALETHIIWELGDSWLEEIEQVFRD